MHVGDLDAQGVRLQRGAWKAVVTVTVHDASHGAVSDATVTGTFRQNGSFVVTLSCTTGTSGTCSMDSGAFPSNNGKATFSIDSVTHSSLSYYASGNHDPDGDSDGTTIELGK